MCNDWTMLGVFVLFCGGIYWWAHIKIRNFDQARNDMLDPNRTNEAWREVILNNRRSTDKEQ